MMPSWCKSISKLLRVRLQHSGFLTPHLETVGGCRSSGGLTPTLPSRRRHSADLLQHAQCVPVGAAFHDLAARDVVGLVARKRQLVTGRGCSHYLALVRTTNPPAGRHFASFGHLILDRDPQVGEGSVAPRYRFFDALGIHLPPPRWKDRGRRNWGRQAHLPHPDSLN